MWTVLNVLKCICSITPLCSRGCVNLAGGLKAGSLAACRAAWDVRRGELDPGHQCRGRGGLAGGGADGAQAGLLLHVEAHVDAAVLVLHVEIHVDVAVRLVVGPCGVQLHGLLDRGLGRSDPCGHARCAGGDASGKDPCGPRTSWEAPCGAWQEGRYGCP